jgi:hypothetical protein
MFSNPEFVRNVRAQLRPSKMAVAAVISAALSLVVVFFVTHTRMPAGGTYGWGSALLRYVFWLQALILGGGGGIACVNAIYKEKDQNTFDYQRVTRLSPLELTLGKLYGAPIFLYFLCLCLVPMVIFCAAKARQSFTFVLAAYAMLLIGSLAFHASALLISLLTVRGSHTTAIIFVLLLLLLFSSISTPMRAYFDLGSLSPFAAADMSIQRHWSNTPVAAPSRMNLGNYRWPDLNFDSFFGHAVHHLAVFIIVDAAFLFLFVLAVARNIKRDPAQYEPYSPLQSLRVLLFINLLMLAFVRWDSAAMMFIQSILLTINGVALSGLGLAQLRNRDRTRRIFRTREKASLSWVDLAWPAPFLFIAGAGAGLLVTVAAWRAHEPLSDWSPALSIFRSLFFAAWLLRDLQFLQWMTLRLGKHPLVMGVILLAVFYACVSIMLSALGTFRDSEHLPFSAFFLPTASYYLDESVWIVRPAIWTAAFLSQWALVALFILAQRRSIFALAQPAAAQPASLAAD